MEAKVYDIKGKESGNITLRDELFNLPWNSDLVHQVATSLMSAKRKTVAHTKNRADVRGGGKKPWQQKGTGRARHGSSRSPIWVGGGVTHGPRNEKNFDRKVSKKMKAKAFFTILSRKYRDGEVLFVDSIAFPEAKTKSALAAFGTLSSIKGFEMISKKKKNAAVVALSAKNTSVEKSMSNLGNMEVLEARNLHPLTLLQHKFVIIENPAESFKVLPGQNLFGAAKTAVSNKSKKGKVRTQ
jgi:large subunit ribosomal protein L4